MESPVESAAESRLASPASDLGRLEAIVAGYGRTLTAYSGGVDSTVVAVVAARVHGSAALAVTGVSASLSKFESDEAVRLARDLGLEHRVVDTNELSSAAYRANSGDRCYHCKTELFDRLAEIAREGGFAAVASGDNQDDLGEHRPGMRAGEEFSVRQPLVEAGLGKERVRALARYLGLPNHDKPAAPCLAPVSLERVSPASGGISPPASAQHSNARPIHARITQPSLPSSIAADTGPFSSRVLARGWKSERLFTI